MDEARRVANTGLALIYGRWTRLHDNKPFDESRVAGLAAEAAGISPDALRRLMAATAGLGDDLSAELRRRLKEALLAA